MGLFTDLFGSGTEKVKQESRAEPWKYTKDILRDVQRGVEHRLIKTPFEAYPGQMYVGQVPGEAAAINAYMSGAGQMGQGVDAFNMGANQYMQGANQFAGMAPQMFGQIPEYLRQSMRAPNVARNPYFQDLAGAITSETNRNLMENILPQITASQGFGSRADIARGIAARGTSDVLSENLARLGAQFYGQGLQAQQGAMSMIPSFSNAFGQAAAIPGQLYGQAGALTGQGMNMAGQAGNLAGQAGALQRAEAGRPLQESMYRHEFDQSEPWRRYQAALGLTMPMATAFGEGTARTTGVQQPSIMQAVGGGLGLAGMGAGLFGGFGGGGQMGYPGFSGGAMTTGAYTPMPYPTNPIGGYPGYNPYMNFGMGRPY